MGDFEFVGVFKVKSKNAKVVYTAVFGDYDQVPPINPSWDCDFVCFTDHPNIVPSGWKVVFVQLNGEAPSQANRRYKILPHEYLKEYDCSLYVDANIKLVNDPSPLFNKYLDYGVLALPTHPIRNCIYDEAIACIEQGRADKESTSELIKRYREDGFPEKFGLTENGVLFRKHNDKIVISLMNEWWEAYVNGVKRDQLSLPYLFWKNGVKFVELLEGPRVCRKYFEIELHNHEKKNSFIRRYVLLSIIRKDVSFSYRVIAYFAYLAFSIKNIVRKGCGCNSAK